MLELLNFNGLMAVYAALNLQVVQRLKATWRDVPERYLKKLEPMEHLMNQRANFKNYRKALETAEPPFIPFQGTTPPAPLSPALVCFAHRRPLRRCAALLLGDLTGLENMPDKTESGAINFQKMVAIGRALKMLQECQLSRYNLWEIEPIMDFLVHDILVLGEEELYKLSKHCELMRKPLPSKKKIFSIGPNK